MSYRLDTNIQSSTLYLDSTNCISRSPVFKYNLATPISCPTSCRMLLSVGQISLPNVINNVTEYNNTLVVEYEPPVIGTQTYTIVFPVAIWNAWNFRDYINQYFINVGADIVCVYEEKQFRYTFVSSYLFRIVTGTTCSHLIGVPKNADNQYIYPQVADVPYFLLRMSSTVNFSPTPFIFLKINNITLSNINSFGTISNSLIRFPVNCNYGEMIFYRPTELNRFLIQRNDITSVEIYLEDIYNNPLNIPSGAELQVIFKIEYIFPQPDSIAYDTGTINHFFRENPIQEIAQEEEDGALGEL